VDGQSPLLTRGMLGVTGGSVQWLHGSSCSRYFTVRFSTARLPVGNEEAEPTVFEWQDANMPALYMLSVYDYDDARGVLVLGNAYGELSLYDFSGSDPCLFGGCFETKLVAAPHGDEHIVSTVRVVMSYVSSQMY
jgi:hypothetical protein